MKIIISSKVAEKLTKKLNSHLTTLLHQPIIIDVEMPNNEEVEFNISSVEGNMRFNCLIEKVK